MHNLSLFRKWGAPAWFVLFAAIATRIAFYSWSSSTDLLWARPANDEAYFLKQAARIASEPLARSSWALPFWQPPGCSLILTGMTAAGLTVRGMIVFQQFFGALTTLLIYGLGRAYFPNRSPWRSALAATLYSACPAVLFYETKLLKPVWLIFFLFATLWILRKPRFRLRAPLAGALLAALTLVESYFALLVPFLAWPLRPQRARVCLVLVYTLLVAPVVIANSRAAGRLLFISCNGGINLFIGNNPEWTKTYNLLPGWCWSDLVHRHGKPSHRAEPLFVKDVVCFARNDPLSFARGLCAKAITTISCRELPRDIGVPCPQRLLPLANTLNALAFVGAALLFWRPKRRYAPFIAIAGLVLLVNILVFPTSRYRLPLLPVAFLVLVHIRWTPPRLALAALALGCSLAAGTQVYRWVNYDVWAAFQEKEIGLRLMADGRTEEAGRHFESAVALARNLETVNILAHYRYDVQNDRAAALELFRECIQIEPRGPESYYYAGVFELQSGQKEEAGKHFQRYLDWRSFHRYANSDDPGTLVSALYYDVLLSNNPELAAVRLEQVRRLSGEIHSLDLLPDDLPAAQQRLTETERLLERRVHGHPP